ncbi:MAG: universal stress protein [Gillisia sp.]
MNVLILTDFSEVAENASNYALQFLEEVSVNFYLLNIGLFNSGGLAQVGIKGGKELALEKLETRVEELQKLTINKEHNFAFFYSENNLVDATRKFAEEKRVDLIVMGAVRSSCSENTMLGNHTFEVIKKVKCNLLAVPENSHYKEPEKILIPIDRSASLDGEIFRFLDHPGMVKKASVLVMEIVDSPYSENSALEPGKGLLSQLNNVRVEVVQVKNSDIYKEHLLKKVQNKFDIIVILGKNISVCDRLLHTEHGIYTSISNNLPILMLHK